MFEFIDKIKLRKELSRDIDYNLNPKDLQTIIDSIATSRLSHIPNLFNLYKEIIRSTLTKEISSAKYYATGIPRWIISVPSQHKTQYLNIIKQSISSSFYSKNMLAENLPHFLDNIEDNYKKSYLDIILSAASQKISIGQTLAELIPQTLVKMEAAASVPYLKIVRIATMQEASTGLKIAQNFPVFLNRVPETHIERFLELIEQTTLCDSIVGENEAETLSHFVGRWEDTIVDSYHNVILDVSKLYPYTGKAVAIHLPKLIEQGNADKIRIYKNILEEILKHDSFLGRVVAQHLPNLLSYSDNRVLRYKNIILDIAKKDVYTAKYSADALPELFNLDDSKLCYLYHKIILESIKQATSIGGDNAKVLAENLPIWISRVHKRNRQKYLELLTEISTHNYQLIKPVAETLPDMLNSMSLPNVKHFIDCGLDLLDDNPDRAIAYFTLESKMAQQCVSRLKGGLALREIARTLRLYATAHSGKNISVKSIQDAPSTYTNILNDRSFTDGKTIYIPEEIARYPDKNLNFKLYKLITAFEAAQIEFGTFDFRIKPYYEQIQATGKFPGLAEIRKEEVSDLQIFFSMFPIPHLAKDLFKIFEYGRIAKLLFENYQGLQREVQPILRDAKNDRPAVMRMQPMEAVIELLAQMIYFGEIREMPQEKKHWDVVANIYERFHQMNKGETDVYQSAILTHQAFQIIMEELLQKDQQEDPSEQNQESQMDESQEDFPQDEDNTGEPEQPYPNEMQAQNYNPLENMPHQGDLRQELVDQMEIEMAKALNDLKNRLEQSDYEMLKNDIENMLNQESLQEMDISLEELESLLKEQVVDDLMEDQNQQEMNIKDLIKLKSNGDDKENIVSGEHLYHYDEWDTSIDDYRLRWVTLHEKIPSRGNLDMIQDIQEKNKDIIRSIRYQFEMLKPEGLKKLKRQFEGDDLDIDALTETIIDIKRHCTPSDRLYIRRDRRERSVSVAFLIDMSNSTSTEITGKGKTVLDVERESLVIMAEALDALGDNYAIYGFSGRGRHHSEFYVFKDFNQNYNDIVKEQIGGMIPLTSTRLGPALRHSTYKLKDQESKIRLLILLSDGKPVDNDNYDDKYARDDTKMALREAKQLGIHSYCITVDKKASDYLDEMYGDVHYTIIQDVVSLPTRLPMIYRRMTT